MTCCRLLTTMMNWRWPCSDWTMEALKGSARKGLSGRWEVEEMDEKEQMRMNKVPMRARRQEERLTDGGDDRVQGGRKVKTPHGKANGGGNGNGAGGEERKADGKKRMQQDGKVLEVSGRGESRRKVSRRGVGQRSLGDRTRKGVKRGAGRRAGKEKVPEEGVTNGSCCTR